MKLPIDTLYSLGSSTTPDVIDYSYAQDDVLLQTRSWTYRLNNYRIGDGPYGMFYTDHLNLHMSQGEQLRLKIFCQEREDPHSALISPVPWVGEVMYMMNVALTEEEKMMCTVNKGL
jgi:hypothetical protein